MQLVGEVLGQVSDQLHDAGVWGFDETSFVGNVGRDLIEAGGTAAVAAATGGNVGAAVASSIAGNVATGMYGETISQAAHIAAGGNKDLAIGLANIGDNAVASAIGGGISSALGGGFTNGASISSAIEQYNYGQSGQIQKNEKQLQNDGRLASITGVSAAIRGVIGTVAGGVVGIEGGPLAIATGYEGGTAGALVGAAIGASITHIIYGNDDATLDNGNVGDKNNDQAPTAAAGGAAPPPDNQPPEDPEENNNKPQQNSVEQGSNAANNPHQVENEGKSFDDLTSGSNLNPKTGGASTIYDKDGGLGQLEQDFESLGLKNVETKQTSTGQTLKVGEDADGNKVIMREFSSDERPTLELQKGRQRIKIRYND